MGMESHDDYQRAARTPTEKESRTFAAHQPPATSLAPNGHPNGISSSLPALSHIEVKLEAVDRLQTQVNLNRASLETSGRDLKKQNEQIRRLETMISQVGASYVEAFERLQLEMHNQMNAFRQQLASIANTNPAPSGDRLDDSTLEIFSRNLATISEKANKVDNLEMQVELVKRKLTRLEEHINLSGPTTTPGREQPIPHRQSTSVPQPSPPAVAQVQPLPPRPSAHYAHQTQAIDARGHPMEQETSPTWATVNTKRPHSEIAVNGSPKRPKLAPLEPRLQASSTRYESEEQPRYRTESNESYPESAASNNFLPYSRTQEVSEEAPPQRAVSGPAYHASQNSPPQRGRGRGGRPRKYLTPDSHANIAAAWPENKHQPVVAPEAQMVRHGADGQYYPITESVYASGRRESVGSVVPIPATPRDPYAHTKKTRTKPVRNAEGILIRKDGRPDMRSQSSAANLRKVHARKEEQRLLEQSGGHASPQQSTGEDTSRQASPHNDSPSAIAHPGRPDSRGYADSDEHSRTASENAHKSYYAHGDERRRAYSTSEASPTTAKLAESEDIRTSEERETPDRRPESRREENGPILPRPITAAGPIQEKMIPKQEIASN